MKNKLTFILLLVCVLSLIFSLGACSNDKGKTQTIWTVQSAYAEATENGFEGTYEEFLASLSNIRKIEINQSGNLIVTMGDDETVINLGKIVGDKGENGVGIDTISIDEDGNLIVKLTNSDTTQNLGKIIGENGKDGINGVDGKDGEDGKDGTNGVDGKDGANGKDGINGNGIKSITMSDDGHLLITYTDNDKEIDLGKIVGNDGINGIDGKPGTDGKDGTNGVDGKDGVNGENGRGIESIVKVKTENDVDYYKITFTEGEPFEFSIKNGVNGNGSSASYVYIRYAESKPVSDEDIMENPSESTTYVGFSTITSSVAPTSVEGYTWFCIVGAKGEKGEQGIPGKDGADGKDGQSVYIIYSEFEKGFNKEGIFDYSLKNENNYSYMGIYVGSNSPLDEEITDLEKATMFSWIKLKTVSVSKIGIDEELNMFIIEMSDGTVEELPIPQSQNQTTDIILNTDNGFINTYLPNMEYYGKNGTYIIHNASVGSAFLDLPIPVRLDEDYIYDFAGWYTTSNEMEITKVDSIFSRKDIIYSNMVLMAVWNKTKKLSVNDYNGFWTSTDKQYYINEGLYFDYSDNSYGTIDVTSDLEFYINEQQLNIDEEKMSIGDVEYTRLEDETAFSLVTSVDGDYKVENVYYVNDVKDKSEDGGILIFDKGVVNYAGNRISICKNAEDSYLIYISSGDDEKSDMMVYPLYIDKNGTFKILIEYSKEEDEEDITCSFMEISKVALTDITKLTDKQGVYLLNSQLITIDNEGNVTISDEYEGKIVTQNASIETAKMDGGQVSFINMDIMKIFVTMEDDGNIDSSMGKMIKTDVLKTEIASPSVNECGRYLRIYQDDKDSIYYNLTIYLNGIIEIQNSQNKQSNYYILGKGSKTGEYTFKDSGIVKTILIDNLSLSLTENDVVNKYYRNDLNSNRDAIMQGVYKNNDNTAQYEFYVSDARYYSIETQESIYYRVVKFNDKFVLQNNNTLECTIFDITYADEDKDKTIISITIDGVIYTKQQETPEEKPEDKPEDKPIENPEDKPIDKYAEDDEINYKK